MYLYKVQRKGFGEKRTGNIFTIGSPTQAGDFLPKLLSNWDQGLSSARCFRRESSFSPLKSSSSCWISVKWPHWTRYETETVETLLQCTTPVTPHFAPETQFFPGIPIPITRKCFTCQAIKYTGT